jgi:hypothetical protein
MWWNERRKDHASERLTEFIREITLLWTVFTVLDRVIADKLTLAWAIGNVGIGFIGWSLAVFIELRRIRE